jgi:hypothetical protein
MGSGIVQRVPFQQYQLGKVYKLMNPPNTLDNYQITTHSSDVFAFVVKVNFLFACNNAM